MHRAKQTVGATRMHNRCKSRAHSTDRPGPGSCCHVAGYVFVLHVSGVRVDIAGVPVALCGLHTGCATLLEFIPQQGVMQCMPYETCL